MQPAPAASPARRLLQEPPLRRKLPAAHARRRRPRHSAPELWRIPRQSEGSHHPQDSPLRNVLAKEHALQHGPAVNHHGGFLHANPACSEGLASTRSPAHAATKCGRWLRICLRMLTFARIRDVLFIPPYRLAGISAQRPPAFSPVSPRRPIWNGSVILCT